MKRPDRIVICNGTNRCGNNECPHSIEHLLSSLCSFKCYTLGDMLVKCEVIKDE